MVRLAHFEDVVARMMASALFPSQSLESVTKVFIWKVRGTLQCDRVLAQARGGAPCRSSLCPALKCSFALLTLHLSFLFGK